MRNHSEYNVDIKVGNFCSRQNKKVKFRRTNSTSEKEKAKVFVGTDGNYCQNLTTLTKVKTIVRHKNYRSKTMDCDIAILTLDRSVAFSAKIQVKKNIYEYVQLYHGTACTSSNLHPTESIKFINVQMFKCLNVNLCSQSSCPNLTASTHGKRQPLQVQSQTKVI